MGAGRFLPLLVFAALAFPAIAKADYVYTATSAPVPGTTTENATGTGTIYTPGPPTKASIVYDWTTGALTISVYDSPDDWSNYGTWPQVDQTVVVESCDSPYDPGDDQEPLKYLDAEFSVTPGLLPDPITYAVLASPTSGTDSSPTSYEPTSSNFDGSTATLNWTTPFVAKASWGVNPCVTVAIALGPTLRLTLTPAQSAPLVAPAGYASCKPIPRPSDALNATNEAIFVKAPSRLDAFYGRCQAAKLITTLDDNPNSPPPARIRNNGDRVYYIRRYSRILATIVCSANVKDQTYGPIDVQTVTCHGAFGKKSIKVQYVDFVTG